MPDYIIAADVGGSRLRLILTNREAECLADLIISFKEGMKVEELNEEAIKQTKELLKSRGIDESLVMGVTLGSAGVPDQEKKILTESPNVPKSMEGRIELIPALGDHFHWDKRYINNDCSTAAECAKRYGHKRQDIKPGNPFASEPYAYRFAQRKGDEDRDDYDVVVYWTISSGTNIGVKIGDMLFKGEFGTIPEFGHYVYTMKDPFGNDLRCGDGAMGHLEAVVSGNGITRMMRNAISSGAIPPGPLFDEIINAKDDKELPIILFTNLCDENAKKIADFVSLSIARALGVIISCYGPGKVEIGGGVMKSFRKVLIPAIELLDKNPNSAFYLQRGKTTLPDICVAKGYGNDYVWRGAVAGFIGEFNR